MNNHQQQHPGNETCSTPPGVSVNAVHRIAYKVTWEVPTFWGHKSIQTIQPIQLHKYILPSPFFFPWISVRSNLKPAPLDLINLVTGCCMSFLLDRVVLLKKHFSIEYETKRVGLIFVGKNMITMYLYADVWCFLPHVFLLILVQPGCWCAAVSLRGRLLRQQRWP